MLLLSRGALNEVIASIKSGIDQLGQPWRRDCCECSCSPLSLSRRCLLLLPSTLLAVQFCCWGQTVPVPFTYLLMGKHHFVIFPQTSKAGTMFTSILF